jgi:hypothetical protein
VTALKIATEKEWRDIAMQTLLVEKETLRLARMTRGIVPVKTIDQIIKVHYSLLSVKSRLETEMYKRGGPKDSHIFYPGK